MFVKLAFTAAVAVFSFSGVASAATIGNWDGSDRSWNSGATLVGTMTGRGHTVEADGAATAANLANDDVFVIGEATRNMTGTEITDLLGWLTAGGRLLVTADSGAIGVAAGNSIMSALGSTLSFSGDASNGALVAGSFLTQGGPFDIVGETLSATPGSAVTGGTALAGSYVGFEKIGSGYIFAFGDHFQNDFFGNTDATTNGQMHINLVEGSAVPSVPLPAGLPLVAGALGLLSLLRRRR